ncbi:aquaporin [Microbacterium radiodurans]|uniref:Aquaporin family protein n=1 Tax=Microbacterium radiodurans TaxID=661398 RepID=A0A5J5ISR1_9MICO|nr:aquaporin [Microbacterium radiodurans]KAA9085394.1 aquaporin family protein [Microbacterium radiodurans]
MSSRGVAAEFIGTLGLVTVVVGSGIAASRLSPADAGLQLLENALATTAGLFVLIVVFQPISGAHFNPVVSVVDAALGYRRWRDVLAYVPAQIAGAVGGAILANAMFGLDAVSVSSNERLTWSHALSEVVATAGLVVVVFVLARTGRARYAAPAVAAYIGAAYWFTSSTSFANPAVTAGRVFSDTFAGIAPGSAVMYVAAQLSGGALGWALVLLLAPIQRRDGVRIG